LALGTENEKKIVSLLYKYGPLSKLQLMERGQIGWATVVKMLTRLMDKKIVQCVGKLEESTKRGKDALLYDLETLKPLAIGVDMEYKTTTIILTNLRGETLALEKYPSPISPDFDDLKRFLLTSITRFLRKHNVNFDDLDGIGIGIPGLDIPAHLRKNSPEDKWLQEYLERRLGKKVRIDVNTRVYTLFEKWINQPFTSEDFMLVSIRMGLGLGIILNNRLFVGRQGFAGGMGHLKVVNNGNICRCGKRGCLETVINQHYLYQEYLRKVLRVSVDNRDSYTNEEIKQGLSCLFTEASNSNKQALLIVKRTARYMSIPLAPIIMVLNVPQIIICSSFGPDGDLLLKYLDSEIRNKILPDIDFNLHYYPIDEMGFTRGAALLILKDFYTSIPELKSIGSEVQHSV
jgi:predicted NBD/HSP70 family sugar kinase